jgi:hypothetical protein
VNAFLTIRDLERLRGAAKSMTHLARFERALREKKARVLDVLCPECHASGVIGEQCKRVL